MARRTGGQIGAVVAAIALAAVRKWEVVEQDIDVDTTAAGDTVENKESLRTKFEITGECLVEVASPYIIPTGLVGTKVAVKLKILASDTNGIVECTSAKVDEFRLSPEYNGAAVYNFKLSSAGTGLVWDLTPAT